jgi:hypothetical protein
MNRYFEAVFTLLMNLKILIPKFLTYSRVPCYIIRLSDIFYRYLSLCQAQYYYNTSKGKRYPAFYHSCPLLESNINDYLSN